LPTAPRRIVLAGSGEFLGRRLVKWLKEQKWSWSFPQHWPAGSFRPRLVSLERKLGPDISTAACAYAVAVLAAERGDGQ
jgi:hypothetical protein